MKKKISIMLTILLMMVSPFSIYAEEVDTPEKEIEIEEYYVFEAFNDKVHFFSIRSCCLFVDVHVYGTITKDSSGNVIDYHLNATAYITDGENCSNPSCSVRVNSIRNNGSYVTVSYTVTATGDGIYSASQSDSINLV